jgi:3-hydroxyacyl-CoA dehydrogenase
MPQAGQFLWAILRDSFHYAAVHLAEIADCARDVDQAMRWGFGMKQGPFELWQEAGWLQVAKWVKEDIDAGKALCSAPLPAWVFDGPVAEAGGVHTPKARGASQQLHPAPSCRCTSASTSPRPCWAGRGRSAQERHRAVQERRCACGRWTARC